MKEIRSLKISEMRGEKTADGKQYLTGYAATYNTLSEQMLFFRERIMPGAFSRALREKQDVRHLINHEASLVLSRTRSGTLELTEDSKGLRFRTLLPDTSYARDLAASVDRGDIDQCSFCFSEVRTVWIDEPDPDHPGQQRTIRELHDVDLYDISTVTYPAYENTTTALERSLFPEGVPGEIRRRMNAEPADEEVRTKRVDGEELTVDCFLITAPTWKLPWKFSSREKTRGHLRNALRRFNQLSDLSDADRSAAWTRLLGLCQAHDVDITEIRSHLTPDQVYEFERDSVLSQAELRLRALRATIEAGQ
jgi:HK97 family phage prohead protease